MEKVYEKKHAGQIARLKEQAIEEQNHQGLSAIQIQSLLDETITNQKALNLEPIINPKTCKKLKSLCVDFEKIN